MAIRAAAFLVAPAILASCAAPAAAVSNGQRMYSKTVTRICERSVLFAGTHEIGTRAGAISVSRDIRRTGLGRLRLVDRIAKPRAIATLAARWIRLERRLVGLYATTYLRIWYVIERYETPRHNASLPARLRALIDLPRPLERKARRLEASLNVPDCTGGIPPDA